MQSIKMNQINKMFSVKSEKFFSVIETGTDMLVEKKFSSISQNNNFNGCRIESTYCFIMKPQPPFNSHSEQMEFILNLLINAFLCDYKFDTYYTLMLSSNQLPFSCSLPLLKKKDYVEQKIINQLKEYIKVSLYDYTDVYTLSACIFVED